MNRSHLDRWSWAALLLTGVLQAESLAWPVSLGSWLERGQAIGGLQLMCMALAVLIITQCQSAKEAAIKTAIFATAWLCMSFAWLYVSMHQYGGLPAWAAAAAVLILAMALSLYYAIAGAVYWRWRGDHPLWAASLFTAGWTMAELARGQWLTGFPWGAIGYAHVELWGDWLRWIGVYGVGATAAFIAASAAMGVVHRRYGITMASLAAAIGMAFFNPGSDTTVSTGKLQAWLLQGNIEQDQKFNNETGIRQALTWYPDQWAESITAMNAPDLVVAPETAIPMLPQHIEAEAWRAWLAPLLGQKPSDDGRLVHWMTGIPLGNAAQGYTNSAWGIDVKNAHVNQPWDDAKAYRYDKHHLVPMGEFIPPFFRWFTEWMNIPLGDFKRGELVQTPWQVNGQSVAAHICFEDVFGEEMAQTVAKTDASVLVNLSNLGWFGGTIALEQHLNIARVRAMELGRPIVRATNTGATAHIDHLGHVVARMPMQVRGRMEAEVDGRSGRTPYVQWVSVWGLWPLWLISMAVVITAVWRHKRRNKPGP